MPQWMVDHANRTVLVAGEEDGWALLASIQHEQAHIDMLANDPSLTALRAMVDTNSAAFKSVARRLGYKSESSVIEEIVVGYVAGSIDADVYAAIPDHRATDKLSAQWHNKFNGAHPKTAPMSERIGDVSFSDVRPAPPPLTPAESRFASVASGGASLAYAQTDRAEAKRTNRLREKLNRKRQRAGLPPLAPDELGKRAEELTNQFYEAGKRGEQEKGRLVSLQYATDTAIRKRTRALGKEGGEAESRWLLAASRMAQYIIGDKDNPRLDTLEGSALRAVVDHEMADIVGEDSYRSMLRAAHYRHADVVKFFAKTVDRRVRDFFEDKVDGYVDRFYQEGAIPNPKLAALTPDAKETVSRIIAEIPRTVKMARKPTNMGELPPSFKPKSRWGAKITDGVETAQLVRWSDAIAEALAQSSLDQQMVAKGEKIGARELSEHLVFEIDAANKSRAKDNRPPETVGPTGGKYDGLNTMAVKAFRDQSAYGYNVLYEQIRDAEDNSNQFALKMRSRWHKFIRAQGISEWGLFKMRTVRRPVEIGNETYRWTDAQRMDFAAQLMRGVGRLHAFRDGWVLADQAGGTFTYKGANERETMAFAQQVLDTITPTERAIIGEAQSIASEMADAGNAVSMRVHGREIFSDPDYVVGMQPDRMSSPTDADMDSGRFGLQVLENSGFTKLPIEHKHALKIGDFFGKVDQHVDGMSKYVNMLIPLRQVRQTLRADNDMLRRVMNESLGRDFTRYLDRTLQAVAGFTQRAQPPETLRAVTAATSNVASSLINANPTVYAVNRVPGSVMNLAWMTLHHPRVAAAYAATMLTPTSFALPENRRVRDYLEEHGYMGRRWLEDFDVVAAPLRRQAMQSGRLPVVETLWTKIKMRLPFSPRNAEIRNAIRAFKALKMAGMSEAQARDAVAQMTRDTQNSSSAIDDSPFIMDLRESDWGGLLPFMSQPVVARNFLAQQWNLRGRDDKRNKGAIAIALMGLLSSIAAYLAVGVGDRWLRRDKDESEKQAHRRKLLTALRGIQQITDTALPASSIITDAVVSGLSGAYSSSGSTLIDRPMNMLAGGAGGMVRDAANGKPVNGKRALQAIDGLMALLGVPTTGTKRLIEYGRGIRYRMGDEPSTPAASPTSSRTNPLRVRQQARSARINTRPVVTGVIE